MPTILLSDRISGQHLRERHPDIHAALVARGLGKQQDDVAPQPTVQFCGMICLPNNTIAMFLPRSCLRTLPLARLTMQALARYGSEAPERRFETDEGWTNTGLLSVIRRLSEDFIRSGIYSERERVSGRNVGKPDWGRTIKCITPIEAQIGDAVIYPDVVTTKMQDSHGVLIAKIQAHVLNEIAKDHGWWNPGLEARRALLRRHMRPDAKRSLWPTLLRKANANLYSARALTLVRDLIFYLEKNKGQASGVQVFGVEDFHHIWEAMLRRTLQGVSLGWNARLPKPVYFSNFGRQVEAPQRGMQTDIILQEPAGLHIIDAKYYAATSASTAPGWPDIAKQMFYEIGLRTVVGQELAIRNSFVFPRELAPDAQGHDHRLHHVRMQLPKGQDVNGFPRIECHYLDPARVMQSYVHHRQDIVIPSAIDIA